jgi:preprotein translocase subunit SecE
VELRKVVDAVAMFEIYKPGQGRYTRIATFVGVVALAVIGAYVLSEKLDGSSIYIRFGVPTGIVIALAALMFWLVNRAKSADFLIATEGEMKKVSWSSRKEVTGSTKVVIITALMLTSILFAMDFFLAEVFKWLKIMG